MHDLTQLHDALARVVLADREFRRLDRDHWSRSPGHARHRGGLDHIDPGEVPFTAAHDLGRWLWTLTSCSTSAGTDPVWTLAGPARCS
jgi:hypothetical protein